MRFRVAVRHLVVERRHRRRRRGGEELGLKRRRRIRIGARVRELPHEDGNVRRPGHHHRLLEPVGKRGERHIPRVGRRRETLRGFPSPCAPSRSRPSRTGTPLDFPRSGRSTPAGDPPREPGERSERERTATPKRRPPRRARARTQSFSSGPSLAPNAKRAERTKKTGGTDPSCGTPRRPKQRFPPFSR